MPIAKIQLPDGRVGRFEVPEGTSPQDAERMAMEEWQKLSAQPERGLYDRARDTITALGTGVTMGYGPEVKGYFQQGVRDVGKMVGLDLYGEMAAPDESYSGRIANEEARLDRFRDNNPVVAPALEVAGGLTTALVAPPLMAASGVAPVAAAGRALGAAPKGAGLLAQSLRSGGQGAFYGGLYGSGEADPGNRLAGAAEGAVIGGVLGAAAPPVIAGVSKGAQWTLDRIASTFPEAWKRATPAQRKVVEALTRDGLTPDEAFARVQQMGPDAALIDVGPNTQGLGRAAATIPGEGKTKLTDFLRGRQEGTRDAGQRLQGGQIGRITTLMDDLVPESYGDTKQAIETTRKGFGANYTAAREGGDLVDVAPVLSALDDEIAVSKGGIAAALKKVRGYLVDAKGKPEITIDTLHQAKMAIDDLMSGEARTSMGNVAKARIRDYQDRLLAAIESSGEAGAQYRTGRLGTAGQWRLDDALESGAAFMRDSTFKEHGGVTGYLAKLSPEEKHAFRIGVMQAIKNKIGSLVNRADATKKIRDIPALENKIAAAFDDPEMFRRYMETLGNERTMFESYAKALTGSRTAELGAEQADAMLDKGRIAQGVANMTQGRYLSGLMDVAGGMKDRVAMSPGTSSRLADLLMSRDPTGLNALAVKAQNNRAAQQKLTRMLMLAGSQQGGAAAAPRMDVQFPALMSDQQYLQRYGRPRAN